RTRYAFAWVLAIPILLGLISFWAAARHRASIVWVSHTKDVILVLENLQAAMDRAESSQRGFLLTGEEPYRAQYVKKRDELLGKIAAVRELTSDNPAQQANVARLLPAVRERIQMMEHVLAVRHEGRLPDTVAADAMRRGTALMGDIRQICAAMAAEETRLLEERILAQRRTEIEVAVCFVLGILISVGLLYYAHRLIERYSSERARAEAELRALNAELELRVRERTAALEAKNQELMRSNQDLTRFAYIASHDLQEPLRTVASYAGLLGTRYHGKLDGKADKYIGFVVNGAKRMQALIQDLLAYSRLGTQPLNIRPVDMEGVLRDVLENLRVAILERRARITHDPLPSLNADAGRLAQLFQNLIGNALKFAKNDETPTVHIGCWQFGDDWVFSVRDNGIGFDPQYAERIFILFQRLHQVGAYSGTGMGLAICRRIVELHGGRIWAESEPGAGSTFSFTLPARLKTTADDSLSSEYSESGAALSRR
ncbi:MAG: CHASE3 domain-containing protein, partial [Acidobacteriaceae bacterium]|nr:CHASE3 domain-containing protein [Acidobacteriaceae bacterium]